MSRRYISPVRTRTINEGTTGIDERDLIIKRLKEELIQAKGK